MYFLLVSCGQNAFDDVAVNVTCLEKLFELASDVLDISSQDVSLFLFVDETLIVENDYLKTLPDWTRIFICKPCQKEKVLIYFDIKRALAQYVFGN